MNRYIAWKGDGLLVSLLVTVQESGDSYGVLVSTLHGYVSHVREIYHKLVVRRCLRDTSEGVTSKVAAQIDIQIFAAVMGCIAEVIIRVMPITVVERRDSTQIFKMNRFHTGSFCDGGCVDDQFDDRRVLCECDGLQFID